MKKFIYICLTALIFVSCDSTPSPFNLQNDSTWHNKFSKQSFKIQQIEKLGDTIIAYEEGNRLYYKTVKGQYYHADITSNTDLVPVTTGLLIFIVLYVIFSIVPIIITILGE